MERFQAAIAIDPTETDAHFQLGRIAFSQKRYEDALGFFLTALKQDEKHSQSEVHPQGLYYNGRVLEESGDTAGARDMYAQAVEAARTAPAYRRRYVAEWSRLAQRQARKLG